MKPSNSVPVAAMVDFTINVLVMVMLRSVVDGYSRQNDASQWPGRIALSAQHLEKLVIIREPTCSIDQASRALDEAFSARFSAGVVSRAPVVGAALRSKISVDTMDIRIDERYSMQTKIAIWGNSRAVRLPRDVLERAGIDPDEPVQLTAQAGRIVITPARRKPTLEELLKQIKPGDDFSEVDYGRPVGKEAA